MDQEKVWDEIAVEWKDYRKEISITAEKFISSLKGNILDVGCGSGRNFMKVEDLKWYACDFSSEMLKYAKENAKSMGLDIELKKCRSSKIEYSDNFFDGVICFAVMHCINTDDERKKTIEEIFRVLKPNGLALISSWGFKSPQLKNKEKESCVYWTKRQGEKIKRYNYVYDLKELEDLCRSVGFEVVKSWEERNVNVILRKPE